MGYSGKISKLELRMFRRFLLIAVVISLANAGIQYRYEYTKRVEKYEADMEAIRQAKIKKFAELIWNPQPVQMRNLALRTHESRGLTFVQVLSADGEVITQAGQMVEEDRLHGSYPIYYESGESKVFLGTLILQIDKGQIFADVQSVPIISLMGSALKSVFILLLILLVLRRFVTNRIYRLSKYFDNFDPDCMRTKTGLEVLDPKSTSLDEVDVLVMGVNRMHRVICSKIEIIQHNTEQLRDKIDSTEWELQRAHDQKANLLRALSHDITNPLTIILGNISLCERALNKGEAVSETKLRKIKWAANSIKDMIDHVRVADAIASGMIQLELEPVSFSEVLNTARLMFEERLEAKNITLAYDADVMAGIYVQAHFGSLSNQVINNLISNALKFSHEGDTIRIVAAEESETISISITDQGIGMPEDMVAALFDGDTAISRKGTNGEEGTGFGMLLVKSCMDYFGGSVSVSSKNIEKHPKDHGTTFTLTFQKAEGQQAVTRSAA